MQDLHEKALISRFAYFLNYKKEIYENMALPVAAMSTLAEGIDNSTELTFEGMRNELMRNKAELGK